MRERVVCKRIGLLVTEYNVKRERYTEKHYHLSKLSSKNVLTRDDLEELARNIVDMLTPNVRL